jgi:hypothetical protein
MTQTDAVATEPKHHAKKAYMMWTTEEKVHAVCILALDRDNIFLHSPVALPMGMSPL